jgi:hypothetical protein
MRLVKLGYEAGGVPIRLSDFRRVARESLARVRSPNDIGNVPAVEAMRSALFSFDV